MTKPKLKVDNDAPAQRQMPVRSSMAQVLTEQNAVELARHIAAAVAPGNAKLVNTIFHAIREWREHPRTPA